MPAVVVPPTDPDQPPQSVHPEYDDAYGNLAAVTDPLGQITTYRYDALGRKIAETLPMGQTETWAYDALGQLASAADFNGQVINDRYDGLGRVVEKDEYTSVSAAAEIVTYTYDSHDGQDRRYDTVASVQNPAANGATTSYFDRFGNLVEIDSPQGVVHYAYDPATGQKTEVSTANTDTTYAYDALGRLTTVMAVKLDGATLATPLATTYAYDLNNALTRTTLPNGTVEARSYDSLDRLIDVVTTGPAGQVVAGDHYTLGLNGNRWVDDQDGGRRVEYGYDALGRLIREYARVPNVGDRTTTYAYDLAGNRTQTDTITHTAGGSDGASSQLLRLRRQRPAHRRDRLRQRTSHHNHLHL